MWDKLRILKEKLHIPSWAGILHLAIAEIITTILWNLITNMLVTNVIVKEIGFLVIFVAVIFAVALYLPKLAPELYSFGITKTAKPKYTPIRLEYDGVLWEDNGNNRWGNIDVIGPLCPKDYTPLATKHDDRIEVNVNFDTMISDSGYHSQLVCPECKNEYTLGTDSKSIRDSRLEVGSCFEGKRRREQQT